VFILGRIKLESTKMWAECFYLMEKEWEGNAENDFKRRLMLSSLYFSLTA
jgi:hypothetical protein